MKQFNLFNPVAGHVNIPHTKGYIRVSVCVFAGLVMCDKTNSNPHWPLVFSQFPPPDARKRITRIPICRAISPPGGHLLYLSRSNVLALLGCICVWLCVCVCLFNSRKFLLILIESFTTLRCAFVYALVFAFVFVFLSVCVCVCAQLHFPRTACVPLCVCVCVHGAWRF